MLAFAGGKKRKTKEHSVAAAVESQATDNNKAQIPLPENNTADDDDDDDDDVNTFRRKTVPSNIQNCFCLNIVKYSPILIIFGNKITKTIELCKVNLISISPNLCQHTTM